MEDNILDDTNESVDIEYSSRNSTVSITKGVIGFLVAVALTAYYLWCNFNLPGLWSDNMQGVISALIIYAILILAYSIISIMLGIKMKENDRAACRNLEITNTSIQIIIALMLLTDWWSTFKIFVL